MTPDSILTTFKTISESKDCVFFAGVTREFLRNHLEREENRAKTFVIIDLQGMNIKEDFITREAKFRFTLHIMKYDNPDSVSQEVDNMAEYDSMQVICLDCYNKWIDILKTLRADNSTDPSYLQTFNDITVSSSDATYYIKPKLLGMMSGVFVNIEAGGIVGC